MIKYVSEKEIFLAESICISEFVRKRVCKKSLELKNFLTAVPRGSSFLQVPEGTLHIESQNKALIREARGLQ